MTRKGSWVRVPHGPPGCHCSNPGHPRGRGSSIAWSDEKSGSHQHTVDNTSDRRNRSHNPKVMDPYLGSLILWGDCLAGLVQCAGSYRHLGFALDLGA
jgi:hypothetical protein